jgi:signal peptidase I
MSIQPPETQEPPPLPVTENTGATPRGRRAPDYRLRGLDLDAQGLVEARDRPARKRHPSRRSRRRRLLLQWMLVLAVTAIVVVLLRTFVIQPFDVNSTSMVPTFQPGTEVLVAKSSLLTGSIKVGDIIVFREPGGTSCNVAGDNSHQLVKRVIGLPGQTIASVRGTIYVNGRRLHEPGWYNPPFGEVGPNHINRTKIPAGRYYVLGDNRTDSCDSRTFGPIRKSSVIGTVVATIARHGHPSVHFL